MNRMIKLFVVLLVTFFIGHIKLSIINAESELSISNELMDTNYSEESYEYEIKQQDINEFLEAVAKYHNLEDTEFEYSTIPDLTMDRYSFENEEYSIHVTQVENSISYGYTGNESFLYYDIQNVINENNLDVSTDNELSFATRDEIQQEVKNLIHNLGIELEYSINIQGITADKMSELLNEYFNFTEGNEEISRFATDLYMVSVNFSIDGIPINSLAMGDYESGIVAEDTVFQLTFTEDGLENADLRGYNALGEKTKKIALNSQEIISLIENKYKNIIILNDTQLSSLELVYLHLLGSKTSEESDKYIPVWLGIIEQDVDGEIYPTYIFIDAETKKELTLY